MTPPTYFLVVTTSQRRVVHTCGHMHRTHKGAAACARRTVPTVHDEVMDRLELTSVRSYVAEVRP